MIWADWIESEYNNGMFYADEDNGIRLTSDSEYYVVASSDEGNSWYPMDINSNIDPLGYNMIVIATLADISLE